MVSFQQTSDSHSLEIVRKEYDKSGDLKGVPIGHIMWHHDHGQEPRIVLSQTFSTLTIPEAESCIARLREENKKHWQEAHPEKLFVPVMSRIPDANA